MNNVWGIQGSHIPMDTIVDIRCFEQVKKALATPSLFCTGMCSSGRILNKHLSTG